MAGADKFFKYLYLMVTFIISCALLYNKRLEILGWGIGLTISSLTYIFLLLDTTNSPKSQDFVVYVLALSILAQLLSNVFFSMTLNHLHTKYSTHGTPVKISPKYKKHFETYKRLFIAEYFVIGLLAVLFFTLYKRPDDGEYAPFFNITFYGLTEMAMVLPSLIFKILLCCAALGISGYMIFMSYTLQILKENIRYVDNRHEYDPTAYQLSGPKNPLLNVFNNLNMNYLMNYKIDLHL
jgi:hypothetical protein